MWLIAKFQLDILHWNKYIEIYMTATKAERSTPGGIIVTSKLRQKCNVELFLNVIAI